MADSLTLAVTSPSINRPVWLWLGLPRLLALIALGAKGQRRHRAPAALAIHTCEARRSQS
jgi:simple sugar transport system permease protein